jgi:hypothetical protein
VIVLLDSGPLGRITNPRATPVNVQCRQWLASLLAGGIRVLVPEIVDYEIRRELLRAKKVSGLAALDRSHVMLGYLPLTTAVMRQAAEFWALLRQQGQPSASGEALDADVILAAQAVLLKIAEGERVVIASENYRHLRPHTEAEDWRAWANIQP